MAPKNKVNPELDEILARPENARCCDCGGKAPRWASVNLGIFFCLECSGAHRNMGVHISTVKSVTLDKWQPKWIDTVRKVGNRIGNSYHEHNCDCPKLGEGAPGTEIQEWITRKYDKKEWVPKGNKPSPGELVAQGRDPDVYDKNHVKSEEAVASGATSNDSRAHGLPPALSSSAVGVLPQPAAAANSVATTQSVDLLGALEEPTPPVSLSQDLFSAAAPASESFAVFDLPDVFAPNANANAQVLAEAQKHDAMDKKVDSLKNSLASLYSQPVAQSPASVVEDRFAALTGTIPAAGGLSSMSNMHHMGYGGPGMGSLNGIGSMQRPAAAFAGMGMFTATGMLPSAPQQQQQPRQHFPSTPVGLGFPSSASSKAATIQSSPLSEAVGNSSLTAGASVVTAEVKHADAMKLVLDSFSLSGEKEPAASAAPPKSFGGLGFVPSFSQSEEIDIDPFSIYGMRPKVDKAAEAAECTSSAREQPLTMEQMMKMQSMVEQACVKAH